MNTFKEMTKGFENIEKIRKYKFKYRDREVTDYCRGLLTKAIKGSGSSSTVDGFLRSGHQGHPDIEGIKRFFKDGCCWAWDQYEPYAYEEFSEYVPDAEILDGIAKSVMDFDKANFSRIENVISKFAKFNLTLRHHGLDYNKNDQYFLYFKLIETDRVTLDVHLELHLEVKGDELNLTLVNYSYHDGPEDRGPYASGWKKWLTSISYFKFVADTKLTLGRVDLISRLLADFIPELSDFITYKSAFDKIKKYKYSDAMSGVTFKIEYKVEYPDHVEVRDYLRDDDD